MEGSKRRVGRPKSEPRNGPLVLDEDRDRQKTEVELTAATARELGEYAAWVEMSSSLTATPVPPLWRMMSRMMKSP